VTLVLSLFPGIGLLDRAFEEEGSGSQGKPAPVQLVHLRLELGESRDLIGWSAPPCTPQEVARLDRHVGLTALTDEPRPEQLQDGRAVGAARRLPHPRRPLAASSVRHVYAPSEERDERLKDRALRVRDDEIDPVIHGVIARLPALSDGHATLALEEAGDPRDTHFSHRHHYA
jgi:hypothetical protein